MSRNLLICVATVVSLFLALPGLVLAQEPQDLFIPGTVKKDRRPESTEKATEGQLMRALIVSDELQIYAHPRKNVKHDLAENSKPKFGEVVYVMATDDKGDHSVLLGRFDEKDRFVDFVGWADSTWILKVWELKSKAITVDVARADLDNQILRSTKEDFWQERTKGLLPRTAALEYPNVTLKAVTHPERGRFCFRHPRVSEKKQDAAPTGAVALQPFGFYYVYKMILHQDKVFCLVSHRADLGSDFETMSYASDFAGWVSTDDLVLWTSREAFEYNMSEKAFERRKKNEEPIRLFSEREHLERWFDPAARKDGKVLDEFGSPIQFAEENLANERKEWGVDWMRCPILERYQLPNKLNGYKICVLGQAKGRPPVPQGKVEEYRRKVQTATANMKVVELVLVVDLTNSMQPVFEPLKKATVNMIDKLGKTEAAKQDGLDRIRLRVAVVGYRDYMHDPKDEEQWPLLEDSKGYFEVGSEKGLKDFSEYMDTLKAGGGGDLPEQPFEGLDLALRKYLRPVEDSYHHPGAAAIAIILGDACNHDESKKTYLKEIVEFGEKKVIYEKPRSAKRTLTTEEMLAAERLRPVGKGAKAQVAEITLHAVFTETALSKEWAHVKLYKDLWDSQMVYLAKQTGGTSHYIPFVADKEDKVDPEELNKSLAGLENVLTEAVRARRLLITRQMETILHSLAGEEVKGPVHELTETIIQQTLPPDEWKEIKQGLSHTFFIPFHTVDRLKEDPKAEPRLKLCILLSKDEFGEVLLRCKELSDALKRLKKLPQADATVKYNEVLVQAMHTVFGDGELTKDDRRALALEYTRDPAKLQRRLTGLPVLFRCLEQTNPNADTIRDVIASLERCHQKLRTIRDERDSSRRFFQNALGAGDWHIWLDAQDLP